MPAIAWHELRYGVERLADGVRKKALMRFLMEVLAPHVPVLPYDDHAAWVHAAFRARLEGAGTPIPFADSQIAAIAIAHNMILVTRNLRDFRALPELQSENWFEG